MLVVLYRWPQKVAITESSLNRIKFIVYTHSLTIYTCILR